MGALAPGALLTCLLARRDFLASSGENAQTTAVKSGALILGEFPYVVKGEHK